MPGECGVVNSSMHYGVIKVGRMFRYVKSDELLQVSIGELRAQSFAAMRKRLVDLFTYSPIVLS